MPLKPRRDDALMAYVLAACPPMAIPTLERVLEGHACLLPVHTLEDAMALLGSDKPIELVVGDMHFDESRMFDLLRYVRDGFPLMPFVSCRMLRTVLASACVDAVAMSTASLGAVAHFDLPTQTRGRGTPGAKAAFRRLLLGHLHAAPASRPLYRAPLRNAAL
jgi:hypothetical protein